MRLVLNLFALCIAAASAAASASAKTSADPPDADCPGFWVGGSQDVLAEDRAVATAGQGVCVIAVEGSPNVSINGRAALRVGDTVTCANGKTGTVVGGATSVIVNGRPLAGAGATIVGCEE